MENICINKLDAMGLQVIAQYPDIFFTESALVEMPMRIVPLNAINAKRGDFTMVTFRENMVILSYITETEPNRAGREASN